MYYLIPWAHYPLRFAFTVSHFTDKYVENKIKERTGTLERWLRGPELGSQHLCQGAHNCLYLQLQETFHPPLVYMDTLTQTRTDSHKHRHGHLYTHTQTWTSSHTHRQRYPHTHTDMDTLTWTRTHKLYSLKSAQFAKSRFVES